MLVHLQLHDRAVSLDTGLLAPPGGDGGEEPRLAGARSVPAKPPPAAAAALDPPCELTSPTSSMMEGGPERERSSKQLWTSGAKRVSLQVG